MSLDEKATFLDVFHIEVLSKGKGNKNYNVY